MFGSTRAAVLPGTFVSNDFNLDTDNSCGLIGANDITNGTANLSVLQNNGGLTQTHLPLSGSQVIDTGNSTCGSVVDQRGEIRPVDVPLEGFNGAPPRCNIGAVEVQLTVSTL